MQKLPKFRSKAFLAPMAGISDPAFRLLCSENGAGLVVTELTSVHAILAKQKEFEKGEGKITDFIEFSEKERPVSIQLFGNDIKKIVAAAKIVEPYFDMIDFNMGCPAPHITSQMAGAALLQKPDHVEKLFSKLVSSVNKSVSLKLRAGVGNNNCYLWKPIAKTAENCGVSMITLHPRTVKQGYSGKSDWTLIRELRSAVSEDIAIVGNGDIKTPEDAKNMMNETGCNYVMIGRGAMGNPHIFEQVNSYLRTGSWKEVEWNDKRKLFLKYMKHAEQYNTIKFASKRTQAMQFTKGLEGGAELRAKIGKTKNEEELKKIISSFEQSNR